MNRLPKAGTSFMERALGQFPLLHRSGLRTLRGWNLVSPSTFKKNRRIERGGVALGHFSAHPELFIATRECGIKPLLMVRDPRGQFVPHIKYVTKINRTHPAYSYFSNLPDDHARLLAKINGVKGVVATAYEMLKKFPAGLTVV